MGFIKSKMEGRVEGVENELEMVKSRMDGRLTSLEEGLETMNDC